MLSVTTVIFIMTIHFIADFILQSSWMAKNKSKSNKALLAHVSVYTLVLAIISPLWALVNGILHFIVDYITSRVTSHLWSKGDTHNFFVVIGLDQLLHTVCLLYTYYWIVV